jgi:hypothetical protein
MLHDFPDHDYAEVSFGSGLMIESAYESFAD